jgi:hypothetical protein
MPQCGILTPIALRRKLDNNGSGGHNRERRNGQWQNGNVRRVVTARKDVANHKNAHSVKKKVHLKRKSKMK